jgi:large subunit ribosomal protein L24
MKIKKGDMVEVIAGDDKGKRGKVLRMLLDKNSAIVEKVNLVKRHMKPTQQTQGGIVEKEARLNVSNVAIVCDSCDRPVRVGMKTLDDKRKVRACKRCGEVFDK